MELPSQEGQMPLPINSSYGGGQGQDRGHGHGHGHGHGGHMIHHDHAAPPHNHNIVVPVSSAPQMPSNGPISLTVVDHQDHASVVPYKRTVRYRECLKNHAASMGGNATDGCGEFMPSGEEGTIEALTCSACNCHRNFHRKEVEGEPLNHLNRFGRKVIVGHHLHHHKSFPGHESLGSYHTGALIPSRAAPPPHHQMIVSYNMGSSLPSDQSDEQEDGGGSGGGGVTCRPHQLVKKRFRTKFTPEQKEKMLQFAEKVGWKIQKQEESVVQQFCQEVGVRRRVLKVWMHNNKHNLAKKNNSSVENAQDHVPGEG